MANKPGNLLKDLEMPRAPGAEAEDELELEFDEEDAELAEDELDDVDSPLAQVSDDELLDEAVRRGLLEEDDRPADEEAEDVAAEMELDEDELELDLV